MKKNTKTIILFLLLIVIVMLISFSAIRYFQSNNYEKSIRNFPELELINYALNPNAFYDKGKVNCYIFFNTECGFCLDEIEDIVDNIDDYEDVNFYLISNESENILLSYNNDSEFLGIKNFTILKDSKSVFYEFFKPSKTPSTFIYNDNDKLLGYKMGYFPINKLKLMISEY